MNSVLHLFRVCNFHRPLINKWILRNICVMLIATVHLLEDLKWLVREKNHWKSFHVLSNEPAGSMWLLRFPLLSCRFPERLHCPVVPWAQNCRPCLAMTAVGIKPGGGCLASLWPWLQGPCSGRLHEESKQCWARLLPPSPSPAYPSLPSSIAAATSQLLFIYPSYSVKPIE